MKKLLLIIGVALFATSCGVSSSSNIDIDGEMYKYDDDRIVFKKKLL